MSFKRFIKKLINLFKEEKKVPIPVQVNTTNLLAGKVALIVGGTGGIGKAIAENFIKNGAKVIIAGTSIEKLSKAQNQIGGGYCCLFS